MRRINKAKRQHLVQCAQAMQPWRIDTVGEALRLCEAAAADLRERWMERHLGNTHAVRIGFRAT